MTHRRAQKVQLKHSVFVMGQDDGEPDISEVVLEHGLVNSTIIVLGNFLARHSWDLHRLEDWYETMCSSLIETDCNLILVKGDMDSKAGLDYFQDNLIYGITNTEAIDSFLFLPNGLTSEVTYFDSTTTSKDDIEEATFKLQPHRLIEHGISHVFSIVNPLEAYSIRSAYSGYLEHRKIDELFDVSIARDIIKMRNKHYTWYYVGNFRVHTKEGNQYKAIDDYTLLKIR